MNRDMRRRKYPSLPDHLANFDQQDIIDRRAFVGNATEQSTMIVKVYGGHNSREYLPGFGGTMAVTAKAFWRY